MTTDVDKRSARKNPRQPMLDPDVSTRLAATEYARVVTVLDQLTPEQWAAPTDCPGWDVRAMAGHMLGMAQMIATMPQMMRQQLVAQHRAKRDGGLMIDALTALQVEKNAALTTTELVDQMRRVGPKAARARGRKPGFMRNQTMLDGEEWWTLGYLFDTILTRDPFMHRIDIARATDVAMQVDAEHEGVIVDDVVREWAGRHGSPYSLELTGPAGGQWAQDDGEKITMDALEFCRALGGRAPGTGLLTVQVPF